LPHLSSCFTDSNKNIALRKERMAVTHRFFNKKEWVNLQNIVEHNKRNQIFFPQKKRKKVVRRLKKNDQKNEFL